MKVGVPAKYQPSLFHQTKEEEEFQQQKELPLKETHNTLPLKKTRNRDRKVRKLKTFISSEEEADKSQQTVVNEPDISSKIDKPHSAQKENNEQILQSNNNKKLILSFQLDEQSERVETLKLPEKQGTAKQGLIKNFDKLQLLDWSINSELEGQKSARIIEEITPGEQQVEQPKVENSYLNQPITKDFLFQKLPQKMTLPCLIRRDKKNHLGQTEYNVYVENNLQHLLTVRKEGAWKYCLYLRYCKGSNFIFTQIATLQSNFFGNKFTLLKNYEQHSQCTVCYETNFLGLGGPRKFSIFLPKEQIPFEYLSEAYQKNEWKSKIQKCMNKQAQFNNETKSYNLNFKGRAPVSSIKNFVVTDQKEDPNKYWLIFGKAGPEIYHLDIQSPFSLIQAVAVAISSFERKITCD